ncbi:hypothetical protein [Arthrobacter sp. N1]|uniref:hypothetical protein n=1 Tax=Arthrobacter sp. N1 TaxID=619291 RepID=UPI003BB0D0CF
MSYRTVSSRKDAADLAALLVDPARYNPVVVVSPSRTGPLVNADDLSIALGPEADVYLLASSSVTFDFDDVMPPETSVYGGAIRSYPPGSQWTANPRKAPFHHAYSDAEQRNLIDLISADISEMVAPAPPTARLTTTPAKPILKQVVEGRVAMIMEPDGALVKLVAGEMTRIDTSLLAPGIRCSRLLKAGQSVQGVIDDNVMDIRAILHTAADAVDHVTAGSTYPCLILTDKKAALFPGLEVRSASAYEPDSVVPVTVEQVGRVDGKEWRIVEAAPDAEVSPALSFVPGAEPWVTAPLDAPAEAEEPIAPPAASAAATTLTLDSALAFIRETFAYIQEDNDRLSEELDEVSARPPTAPVPTPQAGGAELESLRAKLALVDRARIDALASAGRANRDFDEQSAQMAAMTRENERLREQIRVERERANTSRQISRAIDEPDSGPAFVDPESQFRHEVYLEWVNRIPAASKASMPLPAFDLADGFLDCVDTIQGVDRSKIVAVAVEVLTGLADSMPGREMHRLRTGAKGNTANWEHPEHGSAWRVSLQVRSASARRLHFWRGTDDRITLARVGVHDDMGI